MDELTSIILAGSIIPVIAMLIKKLLIENLFNNSKKELIIKSENGRESSLTVNAHDIEKELSEYLKSKKELEKEVQKTLLKIINDNKDLKLHYEKRLNKYDFSIANDDVEIFIDMISSLKNKKSIINEHKKKDISKNNKFILISQNNKIKKALDEVDDDLSFISFSNKKNLNELLEMEIKQKLIPYKSQFKEPDK
jgi:hypothetical protein